MVAGILAAIQLLHGLWKFFTERNSEKRKLRKEALNVVIKAIKKRDSSAVTRGFDRLNRM